jgi:hypothetical protein
MFGISPADLPWWGWLLCGGGAAIIALFVGMISSVQSDKKGGGGCFLYLVAAVFGLAAAGCGLVGIIRFVKWVWGE